MNNIMSSVKTFEELKNHATEIVVDAVVVGSGAGGAVLAYKLAAAGKKVLILEAGSYKPSSTFNEVFPDMIEMLYQDKGNQANSRGDLVILQGQCVGGSTVVNGCVTFRVPDHILADWQKDFGLGNLTEASLKPHFEEIERNLSVHENAPYEININSRLLQKGADKLGWSVKPLKRNVKQCGLTGHCLSGCKTDRKQSMLVTYLPWALEHGAEIYANCRAERIIASNGVAQGIVAQVVDPASGAVLNSLEIKANQVIVAAGAIQTPLLFQRSELGNSSGQVGKNFACHPSTMVLAEFEQTVHAWRGAMLGVYIDEFENPEKGGFVLEGGGAGPMELGLTTERGTGSEYLSFMERAKHYASCVTLIHDHNVGKVYQDGAKKVIEYDLSDADFETMQKSFKAAAKAYFAAGAIRVFLPTVKKITIERVEDIDAVVDALKNEAFTLRMVSYHPQGTMRMGADKSNSVVDPYGQCHDLKNLYVADASLFPTSILVNPQLSVYALSSYIADHVLKGAG